MIIQSNLELNQLITMENSSAFPNTPLLQKQLFYHIISATCSNFQSICSFSLINKTWKHLVENTPIWDKLFFDFVCNDKIHFAPKDSDKSYTTRIEIPSWRENYRRVDAIQWLINDDLKTLEKGKHSLKSLKTLLKSPDQPSFEKIAKLWVDTYMIDLLKSAVCLLKIDEKFDTSLAFLQYFIKVHQAVEKYVIDEEPLKFWEFDLSWWDTDEERQREEEKLNQSIERGVLYLFRKNKREHYPIAFKLQSIRWISEGEEKVLDQIQNQYQEVQKKLGSIDLIDRDFCSWLFGKIKEEDLEKSLEGPKETENRLKKKLIKLDSISQIFNVLLEEELYCQFLDALDLNIKEFRSGKLLAYLTFLLAFSHQLLSKVDSKPAKDLTVHLDLFLKPLSINTKTVFKILHHLIVAIKTESVVDRSWLQGMLGKLDVPSYFDEISSSAKSDIFSYLGLPPLTFKSFLELLVRAKCLDEAWSLVEKHKPFIDMLSKILKETNTPIEKKRFISSYKKLL